jgi:hypothetical protein
MSSYSISELTLAMSAPVVHPTGTRKAKVTAIQRMAVVAALKSTLKSVPASATNARHPVRGPSKNPRIVAKKAHAAFKKELKVTRRKLKVVWKEKAKSLKKKTKKSKKLSETQIKENKMIRSVKAEMKRREKISSDFKVKFGVSMSDIQAHMSRNDDAPDRTDPFSVFIC